MRPMSRPNRPGLDASGASAGADGTIGAGADVDAPATGASIGSGPGARSAGIIVGSVDELVAKLKEVGAV